MTYKDKLAITILESIAPNSTEIGTYDNIKFVAEKINQAMRAQREATLNRMNQYAIDSTGEPLPPEMQFIILHTEVQP